MRNDLGAGIAPAGDEVRGCPDQQPVWAVDNERALPGLHPVEPVSPSRGDLSFGTGARRCDLRLDP
jgi:hypothetical protein